MAVPCPATARAVELDPAIEAWIRAGKHLPRELRDFHAQKDLFRAMHDLVDMQGNERAKTVDWVTGHCYVLDVFLWFMARRGYTLQRTRKHGEFRDLEADVQLHKAQGPRLPG